ncbi:MAG: hypothetical protein HC850_11940 [Rhodomicrobium sp.]|nr:hypothetical protein [Rhodomicrobium sp.]
MGLGILIGFTPWLAGEAGDNAVLMNTILIGVLVLSLSGFELVQLRRWEEIAEIACGVWLIALPYIYGYSGAGALRYWHFALGGIVVLLAVIELWQDWRASDESLAHHGR